jgi:hypothetical protein
LLDAISTVRENSAPSIVDIAENACAADVFVIHPSAQQAADTASQLPEPARKRVARTLSREFWQ